MLETKKEYVDELRDMLSAIIPHFSDHKGRVILGYTGSKYEESVAQLESMVRPLLGFAPYLAGGGEWPELEDIYRRGLAAGSDPSNVDYWGECTDRDQRFVEMMSIALALLLVPDKLWEPLKQSEKDNLAGWLSQINCHELNTNNWQFFCIMVNVLFKKLNRAEFNQERLNISMGRINSYYNGNGWYSDGPNGSKDYYIAFAYHYYGLLYAHFMKEEDPEMSAEFKNRAIQFARDFQYWFDEKGEGIPYGRSLTYRYAQSAFYSACIYTGVEVLPMNVMKGMLFRSLSKWLETPIYDNGHILTIGYKYSNLNMAETYNAPGSPYWTFKAFLFLALDDANEFWNITPAEMPTLDSVKRLDEANMILTRTADNVVCYPCPPARSGASLGHAQEKYNKFSYSTKYGFSIHKESNSLENYAPDCELTFEINGNYYSHSKIQKASILDKNKMEIIWSPYVGIDVTTTVECSPAHQLRTHVINSNVACKAYDAGFAMDIESQEYNATASETSAMVKNKNGYCKVSGGIGKIISSAPNSSLFFSRSAIPCVEYSVEEGTQTLVTNVEFE